MCEDRLQDMKQRKDQNFYMCKVGKDFVIDATFRGNACRFINHSCQPNCQLEKW
jgi:histone-lysine N-methyltransferase SETD2